MLKTVIPKLPMKDAQVTKAYYNHKLGFQLLADYGDYLLFSKDDIEIHFFLFEDLNPYTNYGQVYIRVNNIEALYQSYLDDNISIHPNAPLQIKPWGQKEFSLLDPDHNLLTFGEGV